ncbi:MAG: hypothetical protein H0V70_23490 [Ktedonobacteraceae bacterium]|nr:hypothetical protein [Ktedonobacteraceae bacterium]
MEINKEHNIFIERPLTSTERKAERRKREQMLAASAQQQGYLLLSGDISEAVKNNFRRWCKQQERPSISETCGKIYGDDHC